MKKGVSPLTATALLIIASIVISSIIMTLGEAYIEERAGFAVGVPEVGVGCNAVSFSITEIAKGIQHLCFREKGLDVSIDNGPSTEINDFHARIHGSGGVTNVENILSKQLNNNDGIRLKISFPDIGIPLKITLTPKIKVNRKNVFCTNKAITLTKLAECPKKS